MAFDPLTAIFNVGGKILDKVLPDPVAKAAAKLELAKLAQDEKFREIETAMTAIIAEAKSADPWTSRARPSFMYVMYTMILTAIPMGILSIFSPESASAIIGGVKAWLAAIPGELWALFGAGYLGYSGMRSFDKSKLMKNGNG